MGFERPQIRRREKSDFMQRNVAQDVESPGAENQWEFLCDQPDARRHGRPDDQTVCEVIALIDISWKIAPAGCSELRNHERTECDDIRRSAQQEGPAPLPLVFVPEQGAAP